jgi:hypothetical protein
VETIGSVVSRFPAHELAIRRLCVSDAAFRAICDDHHEACRALAHWRSARPLSEARISQYGRLVSELENEIARFLRGAGKSASG